MAAIADITLSDDLRLYLDQPSYLGVTIGRHANGIASWHFMLDKKGYQPSINDGENLMRSNTYGFYKKLCSVASKEAALRRASC